jgi:Leucine-rich repeat (LRR) protein
MNYKIYFNRKTFCKELEKVENNVKNYLHINYIKKIMDITDINFIVDTLIIYDKINISFTLCNSVKIFPEILCKLNNIVYLDLSDNNLETLPDSFSLFNKLEFLNIRNNKFKVFPEIICKLNKLENLIINNNKISYIPISISKFKKLISFSYDYNCLKKNPYILGDLKNLMFWPSAKLMEFQSFLKKKSFLFRLFFILHKNLNRCNKLNYKILKKITYY